MLESKKLGSRFARVVCAFACMVALACAALCLVGCGGQGSDGNEQSASGQGASQSASTGATPAGPATPSTTGALHVEGSQLCSQDGVPVQLRGVSTHGLAWYPQYVNQQFFDELRNDWDANVVRLALYPAESGGYCTDGVQDDLYATVRNGVDYALNADLYAIVDWHVLSEGTPLQYAAQAAEFFHRMSSDLADYDNVIYEICNEPNGSATLDEVTEYANRIIPVIRENDPDAVIVVGTPQWSQRLDQAQAAPLEYDNVMYALHFYAATHQQELRDTLKQAVDGGLPVFVTEFGISEASGNGAIDYDSANAWVELMDELNVSYVCWSLSNKNETSALIKPECDKTSDFTVGDLSAEGQWLWTVLHQDVGRNGAKAYDPDADGEAE